jgi:hypothetical protein
MDYTPVCGSVAVQCIKTPCPAIEQTFGNLCMLKANPLATFVATGECINEIPAITGNDKDEHGCI